MSENTNRIIYKSRTNLLEIMSALGYNVHGYNAFTINDIDAMYANGKMDMLLYQKAPEPADDTVPLADQVDMTKPKVYVRYFITRSTGSKQPKLMRSEDIDNVVHDLFSITNMLSKTDTLIIVIDGEPNTSIMTHLDMLYNRYGIFVVVHNLKRLQFNLLEHVLVPKVSVLTTTEQEELMKSLNIQTLAQLPEISRYDPMALTICLRPKQVCRIERKSMTAVNSIYYRVCA
jgi:DNA-directed RNA polymerase subunit H (RpoH/RPB5)